MTVHPRTCGEYSMTSKLNRSAYGSSPHVRGIHRVQVRTFPNRRFLPARAGNTSGSSPNISEQTVPPRTCGEYIPIGLVIAGGAGSSPHVRGIHTHRPCNRWRRRFIPARAGNTSILPLPAMVTPVHPRTCGEYSSPTNIRDGMTGSSPHVRGILHGQGTDI